MAFRIAASMLMFFIAIYAYAQDSWIAYESTEINCSLLNEAATSFEGRPLLRADGADVTIRDLWQQMLTACEDADQNVAEPHSERDNLYAPEGTLEKPFPFGELWGSEDGVYLGIVEIFRPADKLITEMISRYYDTPSRGYESILLFVSVYCPEQRNEDCDVSRFNIEVFGSNRTKYSAEYVSDLEFDVSLLPGGTGGGWLAFKVQENDTNLKLRYSDGLYSDDSFVYDAEPVGPETIQVVSLKDVNVRLGPSTEDRILDKFVRGNTNHAYGRNDDGSWLRIVSGWVFADLVDSRGDIMTLPIVSN